MVTVAIYMYFSHTMQQVCLKLFEIKVIMIFYDPFTLHASVFCDLCDFLALRKSSQHLPRSQKPLLQHSQLPGTDCRRYGPALWVRLAGCRWQLPGTSGVPAGSYLTVVPSFRNRWSSQALPKAESFGGKPATKKSWVSATRDKLSTASFSKERKL